MAFRPNSPKSTLLPRCERPRLRPFCTFLNLVRFGCNILAYPLLGRFLRSRGGFFQIQDLAFENPDLNANDSVCCACFRSCIVDISTQGMQRNPTFTVPL